MKPLTIDIPLHKLIAVTFGAVGLFAEAFLAATTFLYGRRTSVGARVTLVWVVLALGLLAIFSFPFLYRGKEWARRMAALSIALMAIMVVVLMVIAIGTPPREFADYAITGAFGVSVVFAAIAALMFLLNRRVAEEMMDGTSARKAASKEPNSERSASPERAAGRRLNKPVD